MLEVSSLEKSFGGKPALRGVSFTVTKGTIYGLLGHNGAGKSTTLGIILGMVAPDAGGASIGGISVQRHRSQALRKVGAIFESPAFYEYLSGWDNLRILMSCSGGFDAHAAAEVVERVGLAGRIRSKVRTYSHGMRQRLALAQALLPEPELLLLDEPTDGLDPEGIKWFRDFILGLRRDKGVTVLFNSHLLSEVELMCDRVAILRDGRRVFEGPVSGLHEDAETFRGDFEPWETAAAIIRGSRGEVLDGGHFNLPQETDPADVVAEMVRRGVRVRAFSPVRRSLEDLYMEILNHKEPAP